MTTFSEYVDPEKTKELTKIGEAGDASKPRHKMVQNNPLDGQPYSLKEMARLEAFSKALKTPGKKKIVVHGDWFISKEKEEKIVGMRLHPDFDAQLTAWFMQKAGISADVVEIAPKGFYSEKNLPVEREKGTTYFYLDLNFRKSGFGQTKDGDWYFDGHAIERSAKGKETSASTMAYEKLVAVGRLEKTPWLDELIKFSKAVDNLSYSMDEKFLKNKYWHTLYAVYRRINLDSIIELFKNGYHSGQEFTLAQMNTKVSAGKEKTTLAELCQKAKIRVFNSIRKIEQARKNMGPDFGLKTETAELGKYILNIKSGKQDKIPVGFDAARALGYDTFITWHEDTKSFFLSTKKDTNFIYKLLKKEFPDLMPPVKGCMIISGLKEGEKISERAKRYTLEKLVNALGLIKTESAEVRFGGEKKLLEFQKNVLDKLFDVQKQEEGDEEVIALRDLYKKKEEIEKSMTETDQELMRLEKESLARQKRIEELRKE